MSDHHAGQPVETAGPDPSDADAAVVLLHGRGASARGILGLTKAFDAPGVATVAPQAANRTWYPNSFMAPIESNEPELTSALGVVASVLDDLSEAGVGRGSVALVGFSQGACLASEFVARNASAYGGLAALSGGLVGPAGTAFDYDGDLDGTPVFLGCSDRDPHIPLERVHETEAVLSELGGEVDERIYEGMGHTINAEERAAVAALVAALVD